MPEWVAESLKALFYSVIGIQVYNQGMVWSRKRLASQRLEQMVAGIGLPTSEQFEKREHAEFLIEGDLFIQIQAVQKRGRIWDLKLSDGGDKMIALYIPGIWGRLDSDK